MTVFIVEREANNILRKRLYITENCTIVFAKCKKRKFVPFGNTNLL